MRRGPHPDAARATGNAPRLSISRLFIVLALAAGLVAGGTHWAMATIGDRTGGDGRTRFAPYVDVTLTPTFHFEDPAAQPAGEVILGFIVADPADPCRPSWGTYYTLEAAARALDLDRRLVRLRERGGSATVSFGGALNDELAVVCHDVDRLVAAYDAVVQRYHPSGLDFDIEGAAIGDLEANERRAQALARIQAKYPELEIWLTLPVAPHGLDVFAVELLDTMLTAGIRLSGLNVMTMNYGESRSGMSMREATFTALAATWQQLDSAYRRAGSPLTEEEIWSRIAATPMIGINDVPGDVFTTGDARALVEYAASVGLARVSFWSANRDVECGAAVDDDRPSNTCSGVDQQPLEFSQIFAGKRPSITNDIPPLPPTDGDGRAEGIARDDPLTSPYPLWRAAKVYVQGDKVTWQGRVYQAKWWTQGDQPDAPVKNVWETPWRYLGPVLESDRDAVRAAKEVIDGTRPKWSGEAVYVAGDEVEYLKQIFRAKWWTQGTIPQEDPDRPYDHPWEYLGEAEPASGR